MQIVYFLEFSSGSSGLDPRYLKPHIYTHSHVHTHAGAQAHMGTLTHTDKQTHTRTCYNTVYRKMVEYTVELHQTAQSVFLIEQQGEVRAKKIMTTSQVLMIRGKEERKHGLMTALKSDKVRLNCRTYGSSAQDLLLRSFSATHQNQRQRRDGK